MKPFGNFEMSEQELATFRIIAKMSIEWYAQQIISEGYQIATSYGSYIHILSRMLIWTEDD